MMGEEKENKRRETQKNEAERRQKERHAGFEVPVGSCRSHRRLLLVSTPSGILVYWWLYNP